MKWTKTPEELKKLLYDVFEGIECDKRIVFGYPAYFINKNMFAGIFEDKVFARLSGEQVKSLSSAYGALRWLEPMPGRPMKDYFVLPKESLSKSSSLKQILEKALEHARTLPPKAKKVMKVR